MNPGIQDLEYAAKEKVTPDHDVIDDAIRENADVCGFYQSAAIQANLNSGLYRLLNPSGGSLSSQRS